MENNNKKCDVILVTATKTETGALHKELSKYTKQKKIHHSDKLSFWDFGTIKEARVYTVESGMGSGQLDGSYATISKAIEDIDPKYIIMTGIAFGLKRGLGEILVSQQLKNYSLQRVGQNITYRGDMVTASAVLLSRLKAARDTFSETKVTHGLLLSGEFLVDNQVFRNELIRCYPEALGGEMEGAGLYAAAERWKKEWVIVKAVSDFGDGNKKKSKLIERKNQEKAAENASKFVVHTLLQGGFSSGETFKNTSGNKNTTNKSRRSFLINLSVGAFLSYNTIRHLVEHFKKLDEIKPKPRKIYFYPIKNHAQFDDVKRLDDFCRDKSTIVTRIVPEITWGNALDFFEERSRSVLSAEPKYERTLHIFELGSSWVHKANHLLKQHNGCLVNLAAIIEKDDFFNHFNLDDIVRISNSHMEALAIPWHLDVRCFIVKRKALGGISDNSVAAIINSIKNRSKQYRTIHPTITSNMFGHRFEELCRNKYLNSNKPHNKFLSGVGGHEWLNVVSDYYDHAHENGFSFEKDFDQYRSEFYQEGKYHAIYDGIPHISQLNTLHDRNFSRGAQSVRLLPIYDQTNNYGKTIRSFRGGSVLVLVASPETSIQHGLDLIWNLATESSMTNKNSYFIHNFKTPASKKLRKKWVSFFRKEGGFQDVADIVENNFSGKIGGGLISTSSDEEIIRCNIARISSSCPEMFSGEHNRQFIVDWIDNKNLLKKNIKTPPVYEMLVREFFRRSNEIPEKLFLEQNMIAKKINPENRVDGMKQYLVNHLLDNPRFNPRSLRNELNIVFPFGKDLLGIDDLHTPWKRWNTVPT
ncbi:MAG: hypothetical protein HQL52_15630 [Magnetococcales bacterium]|nr:hypothetical protein [Magnetococcales bacterium]